VVPTKETYRILALLDDEELVAQIEESINRFSSIEIITSTDSLDLIDQYACRHTRLVILDADLLDERVIQLVKVVRSIEKNSRILLLLSQEKIHLCSKVLSLGMVTYLIKPVSPVSAVGIICSALDIAQEEHS